MIDQRVEFILRPGGVCCIPDLPTFGRTHMMLAALSYRDVATTDSTRSTPVEIPWQAMTSRVGLRLGIVPSDHNGGWIKQSMGLSQTGWTSRIVEKKLVSHVSIHTC